MKRILGIDIGGTNVKLGIVDEDGRVLVDHIIPTDAADGPEAVAERVARWYGSVRPKFGDAAAAGVDCAGLIDGETGYLYRSPNLPGWDDSKLGKIFEDELALAVTVENDVNSAVWGEYVLGAGRGTGYFVAITLGTGVGGGIVADGQLYRGWQGLAGEIGHHIVSSGGPVCSCGNRGCLEALIRASSIVEAARNAAAESGDSVLEGKTDLTVEEVSIAAAGGDAAAVRALEETGRILGTGLANIVHILNPEVIAIGGGISAAGDLILEPARRSMKEKLMGDILGAVKVVPAQLGNMASFLGVSMLAVEALGERPEV